MIKRIFTGDVIDLTAITVIGPVRTISKLNTYEGTYSNFYEATIVVDGYTISQTTKRPELLLENVDELIDDWIEAVTPSVTIVKPAMSVEEFDSYIEQLNNVPAKLLMSDDTEYLKPKKRLKLDFMNPHYEEAVSIVKVENIEWYTLELAKFSIDRDYTEETTKLEFDISDIYRKKMGPLINQKIEDLEETEILNKESFTTD